MIKNTIRRVPGLKEVYRSLDNQYERDDFVTSQLREIPAKSVLLDAGCGSQRYRKYCGHLDYKAQDFGQYKTDQKKTIVSDSPAGDADYPYGRLDYVGNIWEIDEKAESFDAILCTEVLEHIAYPNETIREFSRLLKRGGTLILTAPANCLRHMDPYFFYSGFSDRWYEKVLVDSGFRMERLEPVGDYYRWLAVETARTAAANSIVAKLMLAPAFLYFFNKKKTSVSTDTLCMGYHVVARKK